MPNDATQTCKSCGAPIRWGRTASGKTMPLDAAPHPDGNIVVVEGEITVLPVGARLIGQDHYRSHFATCPNSAHHRKGK